MDPDPDIRTDATDALPKFADVEDAPVIRRSLEGDPVREVKRAAIHALGRIGQTDDMDILRALTVSRSEDRVAWEDELGDWEDGLDIQVAAIKALRSLAHTDSIEDMLAARDDEMAQSLDMPVFEALGRMGPKGTTWLLAIVETESALARKRAVDVLSKMAPHMLRDHAEVLEAHKDPVLRSKATLALRDSDARVQAAALDALNLPFEADFHQAVVDNLNLWLHSAEPVLMIAAAQNLSRFAPDTAAGALVDLAQNTERPLMARIAAAKALATCRPPASQDILRAVLHSPAQQIRQTGLLMLKDRIGEDEVEDILLAAMNGTLLPDSAAVRKEDSTDAGNDAGVGKDENDAPPRIRITPEGDIIEMSDPPAETSSTLSSIMEPLRETDEPELPDEVKMAEDTPEESAPKCRKRRAIEAPNEVALSLSQDAIRTCGQLDGAKITE